MFDYEKIKELSAQKGVLDIVVEKDYVLDWILWGISQNEYLSKRLVFKGGTALHKIYFPNWRFSEDLDFTTISQIEKDELQNAAKKLCENVTQRSGIGLRLREIKPSGNKGLDWSYEVKIEYVGPRKQTGGNLPTVLLHITNDELLLDRPIRKVLISPCEDLPTDFAVFSYSLEEVLAEKIRTVLHQRCWPRDIYDAWRLLREARGFIDLEKVVNIYFRKSSYRGLDAGISSNIDERILRVKDQWKKGLQRQIGSPPDFDMVYPEIKGLLVQLFEDYEIIRGGIEMLESNFLIRYKKGDLEIEVQGDKTFVEEKFKELRELVTTPLSRELSVVAAKDTLAENGTGRKVSLAEFLRSKNPKSHADKILTFAYYLEKYEGVKSFNRTDIENCYAQVRIQKTKNSTQYTSQLTRDGYVMESEEKKDNKKAWTLTNSGLKYVDELTPE